MCTTQRLKLPWCNFSFSNWACAYYYWSRLLLVNYWKDWKQTGLLLYVALFIKSHKIQPKSYTFDLLQSSSSRPCHTHFHWVDLMLNIYTAHLARVSRHSMATNKACPIVRNCPFFVSLWNKRFVKLGGVDPNEFIDKMILCRFRSRKVNECEM